MVLYDAVWCCMVLYDAVYAVCLCSRLLPVSLYACTYVAGDLDPAIRREVWRFLYGLYPANSTHRWAMSHCLPAFSSYCTADIRTYCMYVCMN